jgi:hypothetical protein
MADLPPDSDSNRDTRDETGVGPARGSPPRMPRWVKAFGIIAIVVVILVVVVLIAGGGEHGPSRHLPGGGTPGGHTTPLQHSP